MFDKKLKEIKERQNEINEELQLYDFADDNYYIAVNTVLLLAQKAYGIFQSSEIMEKRQFLNFLLQNLELRQKTLQYKLKTPFDTVLLASNSSLGLHQLEQIRTNISEYKNFHALKFLFQND